jgi:hypothetical protein
MLRYGQDYVDKGVEAYEEQFKKKRIQNMISAAKQMGYELTPIPEAA